MSIESTKKQCVASRKIEVELRQARKILQQRYVTYEISTYGYLNFCLNIILNFYNTAHIPEHQVGTIRKVSEMSRYMFTSPANVIILK